jgi:DNA-binding MarR family transcriptional regulator
MMETVMAVRPPDPQTAPLPGTPDYVLDAQVGFLLRRATQRHLAIFAAHIPTLTPTQFAALAKLVALGPTSQNALGRATAMDAATIKGVVDRLRQKGLVDNLPVGDDKRRIVLAPTEAGRAAFADLSRAALTITAETLAPLDAEERALLVDLLRKLG